MSELTERAQEIWFNSILSSDHRLGAFEDIFAELIDRVERLEGSPGKTEAWLDKAEQQFERLSKHLRFHIKRNHVYPVMSDDPDAKVDQLVFDMLTTAKDLIVTARLQNEMLEAPLLMPSGDLIKRIQAELAQQTARPTLIPDQRLMDLLSEAMERIIQVESSGYLPTEASSVLAQINMILSAQYLPNPVPILPGVLETLTEAAACLEKWQPATPEAREANFWRRMGWIYGHTNMRLETWLAENDMPVHLNEQERSWMREGWEAIASGKVMPEEWKRD